MPVLWPVLLWLLGFFPAMAIAGGGKLSLPMAIFSVTYLLALPGYLVAAVAYNLFLRPGKYRRWENTFLCQKCGAQTA